jgi:hypothetical protein
MVELVAVRGWHPAAGDARADALVCPVYDTMSEAELDRYASASPYNAARFVPRPPSLSTEEFVASATENLAVATGSGAYAQDPDPSLYVYGIRYVPPPDIAEALEPDQRRAEYLLLGLVGALDLERLGHGEVALHERTFPDRVLDRVALTDATGMTFAPILAGYHAAGHALNDRLESLLGIDRRSLTFEGSVPPLVRANLGDATHLLWRIDDRAEIERLLALVRPLRALILDGHHRFTAAARRHYEGRSSAPLVMLVDGADRALQLLPWHRVVPGGVSPPAALREAVAREFPVAVDLPGPVTVEAAIDRLHAMHLAGDHGFLMVAEGKALEVHGPRSDDAGADFDLLHAVLDERLEIDPESLEFVRSPRRAIDATRAGPDRPATAFLLPGLSARGIESRAFERGEVMAHKSTMFLPKVAEGVLFAPADRPSSGGAT